MIRAILNFVNPEEILSLLVLIALLCFMGRPMIASRPDLQQWVRRVTVGVFIGYAALGIGAWTPSTASEFLMIAIRSALAAGLALGMSSIVLPPIAYVSRHAAGTLSELINTSCIWTVLPTQPRPMAHTNSAERQAAARARREREERDRRAPILEQERQRAAARIADARGEVTRFYDQHGELLADSLPPALFRTQVETRFAEGIAPEAAWTAAQEMIAAMLPAIAEARERQHVKEEEQRKAKAPDEQRKEIHELTEWYTRERLAIEQQMAEGIERDAILGELFDQYDRLIKEKLRSMKP